MAATKIGDVERSRIRFGPLPTSVRSVCPVCRCFVKPIATRCTTCSTEFTRVTDGYAQVTNLGHR